MRPNDPAFQAALQDVLRRLAQSTGADDLRWHAEFDLDLGRITDVHDDMEIAQLAVDRFNADDVRAGGQGNVEMRSYTLPELVAALCEATAVRVQLADAFGVGPASVRHLAG